jgi:hypothetical protein
LLEAVYLLNEQQRGVLTGKINEVITNLPTVEVNEHFRILYYELKEKLKGSE